MYLQRFSVAAIVILAMILPLNVVQAGGDDNPLTVTSVPREMTYQGILRDSGGDPVTDSVYSITFRIYDVSSGGISLWDETLPCTTTAGVFAATFSNVNLPFDVDYWLELEIDAEILDPRQKMGMVGYAAVSDTADYAQRVATVDGATGGIISGDVSIQSDLSVAGNIDATGKATIGPGHTNGGVNAFVAGENNTTSGNHSTVGGGYGNSAGDSSTVCGGINNAASNEYASVVCGGVGNEAYRRYSFIGGGLDNHTSWEFSVIGGGWGNSTGGARCTIAGGDHNSASGSIGWAAVGGGLFNSASGNYSYIGGGSSNSAAGDNSAVVGGANNSAQGNYSYAGGRRAKANHSGSFVWGDETDADFASTADDQFLIRASGGVGIGTDSPTAALHVNGEAKCEVGGVEFFMVPRGAIVMWSGTLASIPSGWALCDGTNGTPNLSDRFIYSVHAGENPGGIGGNAEIPAHSHSVTHDHPATATGNNSHSQTVLELGGWGVARNPHTHTLDLPPITVNTSTQPAASNIPPYYKLAFIMKL